jgi:hypothetical protein
MASVVQHTVSTFRRFPLATLSGVVGTAASVYLIEHQGSGSNGFAEQMMLTGFLGISLLMGLRVLAERVTASPSSRLAFQVAGAAVLAGYAFTLPRDPLQAPEYHVIRFWLLIIASHLFVSVAPYLRKGELNGFWQYNKALFLRVLTTGLYALVLDAGLAIALAAIDHLFEWHVPGERYQELFVVIAGIFTPWFFLSGVPERYGELDADERYPKALKVFTQYVLLPLVTVYLVILYAYMGKIAITWNWPQGWVANLVLGFSVAGMFSLLLLYPIRTAAENIWIRTYARWFYVALVPLVILLLLAIGRRVSEYGLTENRYFVIVLGCWLAGMVLLALFRRGPGLKLIPLSLGVLALLAAVGPWSASPVSLGNQLGRFERTLTANGMFVDGKARKSEARVSFADAKVLSGVVGYILPIHGVEPLQSYFDADLKTVGLDSTAPAESMRSRMSPARVLGLLGVAYVAPWQARENFSYAFYARPERSVDVSGFDYLWTINLLREGGGDSLKTPAGMVFCTLAETGSSLRLACADGRTLVVGLDAMTTGLVNGYAANNQVSGIPAATMSLEDSGSGFRMRLMADQIAIAKHGDTLGLASLKGKILLSLQPAGH